jgi:uncharacterized protein (TIGR02246 family)
MHKWGWPMTSNNRAWLAVGLFFLGVGAGAAVPASMLLADRQQTPDPATAARLQQLEDRVAIRDVIIAYGHDLDTRDWAAFANLFAKDGEWVGGMGTAKGRPAIQKMMETTIGTDAKAASPAGFRPGNFHVFTNVSINVDGDTASAVTKWMFIVTTADNKPQPYYLGHYDDKFVREDGQWKFLQRVAYGDIPAAPPKTSN